MIEYELAAQADEVLAECHRRGLVVRLECEGHWHLGTPDRLGTLELTDAGQHTIVKVAANRDGGWAGALADELRSRWQS